MARLGAVVDGLAGAAPLVLALHLFDSAARRARHVPVALWVVSPSQIGIVLCARLCGRARRLKHRFKDASVHHLSLNLPELILAKPVCNQEPLWAPGGADQWPVHGVVDHLGCERDRKRTASQMSLCVFKVRRTGWEYQTSTMGLGRQRWRDRNVMGTEGGCVRLRERPGARMWEGEISEEISHNRGVHAGGLSCEHSPSNHSRRYGSHARRHMG